MRRSVSFQASEGRVSLADRSWPIELDVSLELLADHAPSMVWPSPAGELVFNLENARARYQLQGGAGHPGVMRFRILAGVVEG